MAPVGGAPTALVSDFGFVLQQLGGDHDLVAKRFPDARSRKFCSVVTASTRNVACSTT
jgi:hypothetical protein